MSFGESRINRSTLDRIMTKIIIDQTLFTS